MTMTHLPATLAAGAFTPAEITLMLLGLAALLAAAKLCGEGVRAFGQPAVVGEILAGVILGPTLLGGLFPELFDKLFPMKGPVGYFKEGIFMLSAVLLLFIAGLEIELRTVYRQGRSALIAGFATLIIPFVVSVGLIMLAPEWFGYIESPHGVWTFAAFLGIAFSITALPVIAKILMDLNLSKSDFGAVVISAAMINDLIGWLGFALILAIISTDAALGGDGAAAASSGGIALTMCLTLGFIAVMLTAGTWVLDRVVPLVQIHASWPGGPLAFVIVLALLGAAFTEGIGIHSIFGAFVVGIAVGNCPHLRQKTRHTIEDFISHIFAPLFFVSIGLHVNFVDAFDPVLVLIVVVLAIAVKLGSGYLGGVWSGMDRQQSAALGFAMTARGAMEIILGQLALEAGLISESLFVALVVMALVTSLISGPAMNMLLRRKAPRSLSNVLPATQWVPVLHGVSTDDVIRELAAVAAPIAELDADRIAETVIARESGMPSGIGHEVAVPHGRFDELEAPLLIVGRHMAGLDFDSPDGEEAQIICLILTPTDQPESHLELLEIIARSFHDDEVRGAVMQAESFREALAAVESQPAH